MPKTIPKIINHIGVSVTNLDEAVKWYLDILGFDLIKREDITADDSSLIASNFRTIFGTHFKAVKVAWLSTGNQVGLEIFEFVEPKAERRPNNFEYWKSGFFHICITDPNIDELARKIKENGGKKLSENDVNQCPQILSASESKPHHKLVYCEDPFGNIIEIFTRSYEQFNVTE